VVVVVVEGAVGLHPTFQEVGVAEAVAVKEGHLLEQEVAEDEEVDIIHPLRKPMMVAMLEMHLKVLNNHPRRD
jgi:hypothetical protein